MGLKKINTDTICAIHDISESKRNDMCIKDLSISEISVSLDDFTPDEVETKRADMAICYQNVTLIPFYSELGVMLVDKDYIAPLSDTPDEDLYYYIRHGNLCVKKGFLFAALIAPFTIEKSLVDKLSELQNYASAELVLKEKREKERKEGFKVDKTATIDIYSNDEKGMIAVENEPNKP